MGNKFILFLFLMLFSFEKEVCAGDRDDGVAYQYTKENELRDFFQNNIPNKISLSELKAIAKEKHYKPLENAIAAAETLSFSGTSITIKEFLLAALYIETELPRDVALGKTYVAKNKKTPRDVEYMPRTKNCYIHLSDYVGKGHKKAVYKSILYTPEHCEFVARCVQKGKISKEGELHIHMGSKPGVMKVYDFSIQKLSGQEKTIILAKLYNKGDLTNCKEKKVLFSLNEQIKICADCAAGLESIHASGYVHRDIKPLNILVNIIAGNKNKTRTVEAAITDFGRASELCRTRHVKAQWPKIAILPEAILFKKLVTTDYQKTDVFCLGSVLYAFVTNEKAPWSDESLVRNHSISDHRKYAELYSRLQNGVERAQKKLQEKEAQYPQRAALKRVLLRMVDPDPKKRPSAKEAKEILLKIRGAS